MLCSIFIGFNIASVEQQLGLSLLERELTHWCMIKTILRKLGVQQGC